jgi:hypothetical protein
MTAITLDAEMIAKSIADMILDYVTTRQMSVDKCIELYDSIQDLLERFDEPEYDAVYCDNYLYNENDYDYNYH